ncbi:MAG: anthranilate phosphoribosyltransferase [Kiritimatiellae bacterium]|nr:anthranilate phosphoribosyltransferase [Kiritimatiellia bacterium]
MILMIDNYDSFTYNLVQALASLGADMKVVRNDETDAAGLAKLKPDALVLSPGPGNPDSAGVTLAAVKEFAGKIPILGICLGHQSIAQAFGAKIVGAKKLMHGKTSRLRHDGKGLFAGLDQGIEAMRYHSLAVDRETLPDCFEISAESEDGEIMGLRHKTMPIESLQYHPESIGTPQGMRQLENFLAMATGAKTRKTLPFSARRAILADALEGKNPGEDETEGYFSAILAGDVGEPELAAFLTAIARNPVGENELAGAARAMREAGVKIDLGGVDAVDIVGTGGDGAGTFNVSTAAAFIAAGAGVPIAKHGNVASTSACGSADVLRELGYNLSADAGTIARCVAETGIGFLFARELHPAMRFAAPVRRTLGFRTVFNLLGPLTNPAGVRRHVIGVPQDRLAPVFASALLRLGSERAYIVSGEGGLDEISPSGFTFVSSLEGGSVKNGLLDAGGEYGARFPVGAVKGGDAKTNARLLASVLDGTDRGAYRAAAIENAAAAIMAGEKAASYPAALALAAESVDSGRALAKLKALLEAAR